MHLKRSKGFEREKVEDSDRGRIVNNSSTGQDPISDVGSDMYDKNFIN